MNKKDVRRLINNKLIQNKCCILNYKFNNSKNIKFLTKFDLLNYQNKGVEIIDKEILIPYKDIIRIY